MTLNIMTREEGREEDFEIGKETTKNEIIIKGAAIGLSIDMLTKISGLMEEHVRNIIKQPKS